MMLEKLQALKNKEIAKLYKETANDLKGYKKSRFTSYGMEFITHENDIFNQSIKNIQGCKRIVDHGHYYSFICDKDLTLIRNTEGHIEILVFNNMFDFKREVALELMFE